MKTHTATTSSVCGNGCRPAEGAGDRGEEQQDGATVFGVAGAIVRAELMPACDHVTGPTQVLRQFHLHLGCGRVGHRVQVLIPYPRQSIRRCGVFLLVRLSFAG